MFEAMVAVSCSLACRVAISMSFSVLKLLVQRAEKRSRFFNRWNEM